jgi:hypothetical protein
MGERLSRFVPLAGVVFGVLILVAFFVSGSSPNSHASPVKVSSFYESHNGSTSLSGFALAYAAVFALFFAAALRPRLRGERGDGLVALGFGGAVTFAVAIACGAGLTLALVDHTKAIDPVALQAVNLISSDLIGPLVQIGMVTYMAGYGIAIVRGAAAPAWTGWFAVAMAVLAAIPAVGFFAILGVVIWSIVLGVLLFLRAEVPVAVPVAA